MDRTITPHRDPCRKFICHPIVVFSLSITSALIFALLVVVIYENPLRSWLLVYFVPLTVPFVAFTLERAQRSAQIRAGQWWIDVIVLVLSITRIFFPVPGYSGHALFLTFVLFSSRTIVVLVTSLAVFLEVAYVKLFILDDMTVAGGFLLGIIFAVIYRRMERNPISV